MTKKRTDITAEEDGGDSPKSRKRWVWRGLALAVMLPVAGFGAMKWQAGASALPQLQEILSPGVAAAQQGAGTPVTVIVQHAQPVSGATARNFVAVLQPSSDTALAFQVSGRIEQRLVDTGDPVRAGDEMARLIQTDFLLDLDKAAAEVRAAQHALSVAAEEEGRIDQLNQSGVVSLAKLEIVQGTRQEAASRLQRAQAQLRIAENALGYTSLIADADGVVLEEMIEPGQVITAGQPVLRVSPTGTFEAEVALPESFGLPQPGTPALFTAWAYPDTSITAELREISPIADAVTRTFQARFALTGAGTQQLRYGMTGQIALTREAQGAPVLRLPSSAIYDPGSGPGVWRVSAAEDLNFVPVDIQQLQGQYTLVQAALSPQDRIVRLGGNQLREGLAVTARFSAE